MEFFLEHLPAEVLTFAYVGDRYNLVHLCAHQNWESIVNTLRTKFHLDSLDSDHVGRTLLHWAVENFWAYGVSDHSDKPQAWLDRQDRDGMTALHLAIINRNLPAAESLLSQGARFLLKNKHGKNAVHIAAEHSFTKALDLFLAMDLREYQRDHQGTALLHYLCMWQSYAVVEKYVKSKKPILNVRDRARRTPLHFAARCGNFNAAKVLLKYGSLVDVRDSNRQTPLHYAIQEGHIDLIEIFAAHFADFNIVDGLRQTCLHISIRQAQRVSHKFDELTGVPVIQKSVDHRTILLVLDKAPKIHYQDHFGKTALHRASALQDSWTAKNLIKLSAAINIQDSLGLSPLHIAAANDCIAVAEILMSFDSTKLSLHDKRGCTPLDYALTLGNKAIIKALSEEGAENTKNYGEKLHFLNPYWHKTDTYAWHKEWKVTEFSKRRKSKAEKGDDSRSEAKSAPRVDKYNNRDHGHNECSPNTVQDEPHIYRQNGDGYHKPNAHQTGLHPDSARSGRERAKSLDGRDIEKDDVARAARDIANQENAHNSSSKQSPSFKSKKNVATYPKIQKKYIDEDTLEFYHLPYREDKVSYPSLVTQKDTDWTTA